MDSPTTLDAPTLRALQAPLKDQYRTDPSSALLTLSATGSLSASSITCSLSTGAALKTAGLHFATGGSELTGLGLCSGEMLLEALVACAGVTLKAVATALEIDVKAGTVRADGNLDVRGTLGVERGVGVGFREIRLVFEVESEAEQGKIDSLLKLTERYCVVLQTIKGGTSVKSEVVRKG
ncbi:hypothetical protein MMC30_007236 [Trapelia coarctata]|nr:hypothetical protein [Trapelia coarctata]